MISLEILEKHGINRDSLQKALAGDPLAADPALGMVNAADPDEIKNKKAAAAALVRRIRSRVQEGMNRNFADYQLYRALDLAYDAPFRQVSPTIIQHLVDTNPDV